MNLVGRIAKQARMYWKGLGIPDVPSPPFLILFINSICNMKCEHCFYWQQLNSPDDLTFEEMVSLSEQLGPIENLNLSGGEPFLRKEFAEICKQFVRHNGVKEIYVPTNGYFTEKTITQVRATLEEPSLRLFVAEISLDGCPIFTTPFVLPRMRSRKRWKPMMRLWSCKKRTRACKFIRTPARLPTTWRRFECCRHFCSIVAQR